MVARYDRQGKSDGSAVRVNPRAGDAAAWRGDPPTIKVGLDGSVFVGWTAPAGPSSGRATTLYLSASRDGGRSFDAPVKVNNDSRPAVHGMHSLAVAADNRVHLAWLDERNARHAPPVGKAGGHHEEGNREVFMATCVSATVVKQLLHKHDYRRRKAQKRQATGEASHRDEQFLRITKLKAEYLASPNPVISMDTKKKR
jgi:hypothetical protein